MYIHPRRYWRALCHLVDDILTGQHNFGLPPSNSDLKFEARAIVRRLQRTGRSPQYWETALPLSLFNMPGSDY